MVEARVAPAAPAPGIERAVPARSDDRRPDRRPALGVRVEQQAGPFRRRDGPGDEVGDGNGVALDGRLLLRCERSRRRGIGAAVDADGERARRDPWRHLELDLERRGADLLEPEPVLLDEVEREPVRARRPGRRHGELELDPFPRRDGVRQAACGGRPRRSGCRAGRASGRTPGRRPRRASARSPCRRSRARRAPSR